MKSGDLVKIWLGVLFENSIVCHVFYAMALGAARVCVWFLGFVLFWFAWSCFFVVGLGWAWSGFLDCVLTFFGVLAGCFGWLGSLVCWFCLESLILAQDERWRRA